MKQHFTDILFWYKDLFRWLGWYNIIFWGLFALSIYVFNYYLPIMGFYGPLCFFFIELTYINAGYLFSECTWEDYWDDPDVKNLLGYKKYPEDKDEFMKKVWGKEKKLAKRRKIFAKFKKKS